MCLLALRDLQINPSNIDTNNRHSSRVYVCSQSCLTLCDFMDCSPPGSTVHGILQTRILELVAMPSSPESTWPRDRIKISCISCIAGGFFITSASWEAHLEDISSVQFSRSDVSNSLRPHESRYARPPCPSLTPRVHSDSRPSSQWCHPAISSSAVPFSSCPQSLPASESFLMS